MSLSMLKPCCLWLLTLGTLLHYNPTGPTWKPLARNSFIFFRLIRFPMKKIIVLLIKCLSYRRVNVISAPDKAAHTDLALCSGALKSADKTAVGEGFCKKIENERKKKKKKKKGELEGRWIANFHSQQDVVCDCWRPPTWEQQQRQAVYLSTLAYWASGLRIIRDKCCIFPRVSDNTLHYIIVLVIV